MPGINRKGNTRIVQKSSVKVLPKFPELGPGGTGRIFTKHYVNLVFKMDQQTLSLLSFLIYQSEVDNTIKYSSKLLEKYGKVIKLTGAKLKTSQPVNRRIFKSLIENGYLLPTGKTYLINPNLTYSKQYVKGTFYVKWIKEYDQAHEPTLYSEWISHVKDNL